MGCCESSARVSSGKVNGRDVPNYLEIFNGPVRERSCTDQLFLFLLIVYVLLLIITVCVVAKNSEPRRLVYGYDDYGNVCGIKNTAIPEVGGAKSGQDKTDMKYLVLSSFCSKNGSNCTFKRNCEKVCPFGYKPSALRRCVSESAASYAENAFKFAKTWFEEAGSDIALCWKHFLVLCMISIGLSVLMLVIFRFCTTIIIWAVLGMVAIASIAITIFLWVTWNKKKGDLEKSTDVLKGDSEINGRQQRNWLTAAIIATIFTVIYIIIMIVMRNRIKLVAALFQEAGKAVSAMPLILLLPVWTFIGQALACFFLLIGFLLIQTAGNPVIDKNDHVSFQLNSFCQAMRWVSLFGFFWISQFIFACQNLVTAGAVSSWFFTRDKSDLRSPILRSLRNTIFFHLGSAALGSLIIALMKLIRALLRLLEKYINDQGKKCEIFWKIFQCCLSCFENYLKFLNRNAFIMIAIYGESFSPSARRAFRVIAANCLRLVSVNYIGDVVLFAGKIGVTIATAFIGIEIIKQVNGVNYIWIPVALACIFAFMYCHCFLSVYEMVIDTLLLCFCEDCEMNDGVTKPYFMSRSLMVLIEKNKRNGENNVSLKGK